MVIKFKVDIWRKGSTINNFNPKLSNYWQQQLQDMFRGW